MRKREKIHSPQKDFMTFHQHAVSLMNLTELKYRKRHHHMSQYKKDFEQFSKSSIVQAQPDGSSISSQSNKVEENIKVPVNLSRNSEVSLQDQDAFRVKTQPSEEVISYRNQSQQEQQNDKQNILASETILDLLNKIPRAKLSQLQLTIKPSKTIVNSLRSILSLFAGVSPKVPEDFSSHEEKPWNQIKQYVSSYQQFSSLMKEFDQLKNQTIPLQNQDACYYWLQQNPQSADNNDMIQQSFEGIAKYFLLFSQTCEHESKAEEEEIINCEVSEFKMDYVTPQDDPKISETSKPQENTIPNNGIKSNNNYFKGKKNQKSKTPQFSQQKNKKEESQDTTGFPVSQLGSTDSTDNQLSSQFFEIENQQIDHYASTDSLKKHLNSQYKRNYQDQSQDNSTLTTAVKQNETRRSAKQSDRTPKKNKYDSVEEFNEDDIASMENYIYFKRRQIQQLINDDRHLDEAYGKEALYLTNIEQIEQERREFEWKFNERMKSINYKQQQKLLDSLEVEDLRQFRKALKSGELKNEYQHYLSLYATRLDEEMDRELDLQMKKRSLKSQIEQLKSEEKYQRQNLKKLQNLTPKRMIQE